MKKRFFRRVTAFVVAFLMTFGVVAVLPEECLPQISIAVSAEEIIASGQCGDNVFGTLNDKGVLTISGTGEMYDFAASECVGSENKMKVNKVIINEGVTSIGERAFEGCSNLINIEIPNSVSFIDKQAFASCSSLSSINIPNNVTSIEYRVFAFCSNLTSVTISDNLNSINEGAFFGCEKLTNIVLR